MPTPNANSPVILSNLFMQEDTFATLATDADGDTLSFTATPYGPSLNGTISNAPDGSLVFTPDANFNGESYFTLTVTDGLNTEQADVLVQVQGTPDAPQLPPYTTNPTNTILLQAQTTYYVGNGYFGGYFFQATGNATLSSALAFADDLHGYDEEFYITTGDPGSATLVTTTAPFGDSQTTLFTVFGAGPPVNTAPVGAGDALTTGYGSPVVVTAGALTANDTDADNDPLTITGVSGALHGVVAFEGTNVTFIPYLGYAGAASFSYAIDDGHGGTASAQVVVTVAGPGGGAQAAAYTYGSSLAEPQTYDFTGDSAYHQLLAGAGDTTVYTGSGGSSVRLGAGPGVVFGGAGKDNITFGSGLDTVTGGGGSDVFILSAGLLADLALTGGAYDTVTDFSGAGQRRAPDGDFLYFKGFNKATATVTYEHDLASDPTQHVYKIDDGIHSGEFVLGYVGQGVDLVTGQFGFL